MSGEDIIWRTVSDKTNDAWLEVDDGEGWWSAFVKWDGCLEVTRYFNVPYGEGNEDNESTIHICDLDEFIARLEALRALARQHFGDWPR